MEEIIVKEQKLRIELEKLINEANLPALILEPIIKDLLQEITRIKIQQYELAEKVIEDKKKSKKKEEK